MISSNTSVDFLFGINGVEKMRLATSGKVGINDTTPDAMLDITTTGNSVVGLIVSGYSGAATGDLIRLEETDGANTRFSVGAEGVVYAQGNVGIGNTAPPQPLTVEGNISGSRTGSFGVLKTGDIELENERGHWRIIEESEYLSIHNVKSGKKYKFVLEEIE